MYFIGVTPTQQKHQTKAFFAQTLTQTHPIFYFILISRLHQPKICKIFIEEKNESRIKFGYLPILYILRILIVG
ncbi:uncharacterized protein OCT59_024442 [Rhizophagus irregularis]|uniref:uncharacterized protein n=1 Tax=Rhizophagus irregularis TaxID=588596 RepID=UPI00331E6E00|nr:hypothetical protein OCT59_024442 [Rhizophagus irregularis]